MKFPIVILTSAVVLLSSMSSFAAPHRIHVRNGCGQHTAHYIPVYARLWNEDDGWHREFKRAWQSPGGAEFIGETEGDTIQVFAKGPSYNWEGTSSDYCEDIQITGVVSRYCFRPIDISELGTDVLVEFKCRGAVNVTNKERALILENNNLHPDHWVIYYSLGYKVNDEWYTMGWFGVKGNSPQYITLNQNVSDIYCYAEVGDTHWPGSDESFCIQKDLAFGPLQQEETCSSPYYLETNFRKAIYRPEGDYFYCGVNDH